MRFVSVYLEETRSNRKNSLYSEINNEPINELIFFQNILLK